MDEQKPRAGANVLVVDDTPANLKLLYQMLTERGFDVRLINSGKGALRAVEAALPDLILLDINMPEMNGYEVCSALKEKEEYREIPVIFISALHEPMDKVRGFKVGGVDYVTKPFQYEEVIARVETHLKIAELQHHLQERNIELKVHVERLQELERLRDGMLHMVVHDMRSPLTGLIGFLELLGMEHKTSDGCSCDSYIEDAMLSANILEEMISSLLDVNRLENGQMPLELASCQVSGVVGDAITSLGALVSHHDVQVHQEEPALSAKCDAGITSRIVANLVSNATRYAPEGSEIAVHIGTADGMISVRVADKGIGIAPEHHALIFEKFGQVQMRNAANGKGPRSTGLGLAFCKLAVEAQGGKIGVESEPGQGSTFWFTLPRAE